MTGQVRAAPRSIQTSKTILTSNLKTTIKTSGSRSALFEQHAWNLGNGSIQCLHLNSYNHDVLSRCSILDKGSDFPADFQLRKNPLLWLAAKSERKPRQSFKISRHLNAERRSFPSTVELLEPLSYLSRSPPATGSPSWSSRQPLIG